MSEPGSSKNFWYPRFTPAEKFVLKKNGEFPKKFFESSVAFTPEKIRKSACKTFNDGFEPNRISLKRTRFSVLFVPPLLGGGETSNVGLSKIVNGDKRVKLEDPFRVAWRKRYLNAIRCSSLTSSLSTSLCFSLSRCSLQLYSQLHLPMLRVSTLVWSSLV